MTDKQDKQVVHWYGGVVRQRDGGVMVYPSGLAPCGKRGLRAILPENVSCPDCSRLLRTGQTTNAADALREAAEPLLTGSGRLSPALDARALLDPQPDPVSGTGDVWAAVIDRTTDERLLALYRARREQGIERYGVPLQADNGRDHLTDALQEVVDARAYLEAAGLGQSALVALIEEIILDVTRKIEVRDA